MIGNACASEPLSVACANGLDRFTPPMQALSARPHLAGKFTSLAQSRSLDSSLADTVKLHKSADRLQASAAAAVEITTLLKVPLRMLA